MSGTQPPSAANSSSRRFGPLPSTLSHSLTPPPALAPSTPPSLEARGRASSGAATTAAGWLNALSDGLSWIEVQGGSVVAQAAEKGIGETIRGGLGRRPLSFGSFSGGSASSGGASAGGGSGAGGWGGGRNGLLAPEMGRSGSNEGSVGGSAVDLGASPPAGMLYPNGNGSGSGSAAPSVGYPSNTIGRLARVRPSSFLGLPRPGVNVAASDSALPMLESGIRTAPPGGATRPPAPANLARLGSTPVSSGPTMTATTAPAPALHSRSSLSGPSVVASPPNDSHTPHSPARRHRPSLSNPHAGGSASSAGQGSTASVATASAGSGIPRSASSGAAVGGLWSGNLGVGRGDGRSAGGQHSVSFSGAGGPKGSTAANGTGTGALIPPRSSSYAPQSTSSGSTLAPAPTAQRSRTDLATNTLATSQASSRAMSRSPSASSRHGVGAAAAGPSTSVPAPRGQTLYKPGYQPPGVRRSRMTDFERAREVVGEERGREEGRLGRRWGKLLDLHFNPHTTAATPSDPPALPRSPSLPGASSANPQRRSFLPSLPYASDLKAKDVWRGLRSVSGVGVEQVAEERRREAEMGIVKWEEDGEVRRCRICGSVFSLTNRKHHCRLCGRIVCSLPPTATSVIQIAAAANGTIATPLPLPLLLPPPTRSESPLPAEGASANHNPRTGLPMGIRREKCSVLLVADWRTGRGEIVEEGFVGWMKVEKDAGGGEDPNGSGAGGANGHAALPRKKRLSEITLPSPITEDKKPKRGFDTNEVMVKGVRCCRECWAVVSRKQKILDRRRASGFTRLYDALKEVEAEITDLLPEFQDMLDQLESSAPTLHPLPPIPSDLVALHKHILVLFTQYDALSKKIRAYPPAATAKGLPPSAGEIDVSAQKRVQEAIARQAASFVTREAGILQALPKLQKQRHKRAASSVNSTDSAPFTFSEMSTEISQAKAEAELDDELALALQPLLEQEAMLEGYIKAANAQRKFDDARTLKASLDDIKREIGHVVAKCG